MFSKYVQRRLERYVKKYFKTHSPTLIAVVGSAGKTTTKTAIATALSRHYRIQLEPGNHNTPLSVPLAIMGVKYPPMEMVHSIGTWRQVFKAMKQRVKAPQGLDVIIQELATDHPGDLAVYRRYLRPDITVVTSVAPEHMENFPGGLADVAREELSMAAGSNLTIVNHDDIDASFAQYADTNNITDYGIDGGEYRIEVLGGSPLDGYQVAFYGPELNGQVATTTVHVVGNHMLKAVCAAFTVGIRMGVPVNELMQTLAEIRPVEGRMNPLAGRNGSTLIDDSYNAAPTTVIAALETLYQIEAPQRIAILGSMNELGNFSATGHQQVGQYCDPMMLDWVITIGDAAGQWLAPAAAKSGCQVRSFPDPVAAGTFANQVLEKGAVVLIKGSQNGVFSEEATKVLLANVSRDSDKLVRQSDYWTKRKQDWFGQLSHQDESRLGDE
ncbi:MAG: Mur ligase family protein [Candidatus Saccharibacteria bacterium]|nr:Mur ligase family protein [Candidatus Saccharibacteria bacterium]